MPFELPTTPSAGDEYTYLGVTYVYNGLGWTPKPDRSDYFEASEIIVDNSKTGLSSTKLQNFLDELTGNIPRKNLLLNASFLLNMRGHPGGALSLGDYFFDCWKAVTAGNISLLDGNGFLTINSGVIGQILELGNVELKKFTVSAKTFGTEVDVTVAGIAGTVSDSQSFTVTIPEGFTGNIPINFSGDGSKLKDIQFEYAGRATSYELRPTVKEKELVNRYGYVTEQRVYLTRLTSSAKVGAFLRHPVKMAVATPDVTVQTDSNIDNLVVNSNADGIWVEADQTDANTVAYIEGISVRAEL